MKWVNDLLCILRKEIKILWNRSKKNIFLSIRAWSAFVHDHWWYFRSISIGLASPNHFHKMESFAHVGNFWEFHHETKSLRTSLITIKKIQQICIDLNCFQVKIVLHFLIFSIHWSLWLLVFEFHAESASTSVAP